MIVDNNNNEYDFYIDNIKYYEKEYCESIDNIDLLYNKTTSFNGMIKYIYLHVFKPNKKMLYNCTTILDTGNIELLSYIWDYGYSYLCSKYAWKKTLLRFSMLVGVSMELLNGWKDGRKRSSSPAHSETVKKWLAECELDLVDSATEFNSIGSIFALKANYGYTDAPQKIIVTNGSERLSSAEIAQRHAGAALPDEIEKPNI